MNFLKIKYVAYAIGFIIIISLFSGNSKKEENLSRIDNEEIQIQEQSNSNELNLTENNKEVSVEKNKDSFYKVVKVVDGDTIDVNIDGVVERIRIIGINTPETVDPRKPVECFGVEASNKAKSLLSNKEVRLEADTTQGDRDKYSRLLRYVFLQDNTDFGLKMIQEGYAYEYTYNTSYRYQSTYKDAQKYAEKNKLGLWGDKCNQTIETPIFIPIVKNTSQTGSCAIKGNINSKKEKIYHYPGCGSYNQTVIDESKGEKWFCSEQEALDLGWRRALNCN